MIPLLTLCAAHLAALALGLVRYRLAARARPGAREAAWRRAALPLVTAAAAAGLGLLVTLGLLSRVIVLAGPGPLPPPPLP